jgi:hypothetical protein
VGHRGPEGRFTVKAAIGAHVDELSRAYRGPDDDGANVASERVIVHIEPEIQHAR